MKYFSMLWLPVVFVLVALSLIPSAVLSVIGLVAMWLIFTGFSFVGLAFIGSLIFEHIRKKFFSVLDSL